MSSETPAPQDQPDPASAPAESSQSGAGPADPGGDPAATEEVKDDLQDAFNAG